MNRFQAEDLVWEFIEEIEAYAKVFATRVARVFENLEQEFEQLRSEKYGLAANSYTPEGAVEWAHDQAMTYWHMTDSVRQGLFNLMTAGLYHLGEQQAAILLKRGIPKLIGSNSDYPMQELERVLSGIPVDIRNFQTYAGMETLRLIANVVKHGDGNSANRLRQINPSLFVQYPWEIPGLSLPSLPLRPLWGEGLRLTEDAFETAAENLVQFWKELAEVLFPIYCPSIPTVPLEAPDS